MGGSAYHTHHHNVFWPWGYLRILGPSPVTIYDKKYKIWKERFSQVGSLGVA